MNNLIIGFKKFIANKNTVTIIIVIIILALLYFGYTSKINSSVNPVSIPVANTTIQPRTEITADMIETIQVPRIAVKNNVIQYTSQIIGKYTAINSVIPQGSMFYKEVLVNKSDLPDSVFSYIKEGDIPYQFPVTVYSTFGNSIFPGNKIDIYMKAQDEKGLIMIGRLLENVEVLAVKDSSGKNVFENTSETRTPAYLIFGLPERIHILMRKATYLSGVELIPVPHGGTVPTDGAMQVDIEELQNYIESRTINLLKEDLEAEETKTEETTTQETNTTVNQ